MSTDSHAHRWHARRPQIHYAPLGFSLDKAPPRVPALELEALLAEPMNLAAIGVAAARLERVVTSNRVASKDMDMRVGE